MKFQIVGYTLGLLITILGFAEMLPAVIDWSNNDANASIFFFNGVLCLFFGGCLIIANRNNDSSIRVREAFLLTTLSWIFLAAFAALPLYMAGLEIDYADAYFEAMSGFTTTGSTVLSGLDQMSPGILFWRSMIQWIGGVGIVAFAIVLLPFLKVGGMQLFHAESSDKSEKIMPRSKDIIASIFQVYGALTVIIAVTYNLLGMSWFDAINHAMTTVSTAGFSTHDKSFGFYPQASLQYAASFFMFISSLPFTLFVLLMFKRRFMFWQDEQVRAFTFTVASMVGILAVWLWLNSTYSLEQSLRYSLFNMISIISTTGYINANYDVWGSFSTAALLFAAYIGGTAGSTSGGPKTMRLIIAAKMVGRQIKTLLYPRGYFPVYYQGRPVEENLAMNILGFLSFYVLSNVVLSVAVAATGVDFLTAVSAVASTIGNVGAGVGPVVGSSGSFASLPDGAKWILSFAMLLGRLEILTVVVLFSSHYWRK